MILGWLCAIFRRRKGPEADRIAMLESRLSLLEYLMETDMSRTDELAGIVTDLGVTIDAVVKFVNDTVAALATAGAEDPRIGEAVDTLVSLRARLEAFLPPPVTPPDRPA